MDFALLNTEKIVLACCVLHNFVKTHTDSEKFETRICERVEAEARRRGLVCYDNSDTQEAKVLRDELKDYLAANRII